MEITNKKNTVQLSKRRGGKEIHDQFQRCYKRNLEIRDFYILAGENGFIKGNPEV